MERLSQVTALHIFGDTHEGMSGKHNEDSYGVFAWRLEDNQVLHLWVVADCVGGQIAGEIASSVTVDSVCDYFDRQVCVNYISCHL
jgi:serine/threonine protein phosphatase PrpC